MIAIALGAASWVRRQTSGSRPDEVSADRSGMLPPGPASTFLTPQRIGDPIRGDERPRIANVAIVDLDRDGLADVLVCDALRNRVTWIRQSPRGSYAEIPVGGDIAAPAHVEGIDFEGDGDLDLVVAALGVLMPSNNRTGSVIILENDGRQNFTRHVIL
ncbi:MAG: FG-GAP repeat domain-containing protein, partial [Vicinamibacterales bacterium]